MRGRDLEPRRVLGSGLIHAVATVLLWTQVALNSAGVALPHEEISSEATPRASASSTPEVVGVDPPRAAAKSEPSLKIEGTLIVTGQKLTYEEGGKEVFSTPLSKIREIGTNVIFGLNTGTFHINLTSGKTYNFIAGSLRAGDSQSIIASLRKAIH